MIDLVEVATILANAYPPIPADQLFTRIGEDFQRSYDGTATHLDHMHDAIAELEAKGKILRLIAEVIADEEQQDNLDLIDSLRLISQEKRWERLGTAGLMLTAGPFVNRKNLKGALNKVQSMGRRVLRIGGTTGAKGRSWSRQLIAYRAAKGGVRYCEADLRAAPPEARSSPMWLAEKLRGELFPQSAREAFFAGIAESRLVEAFIAGWLPQPKSVIVAIDHLGEDNLGQPVKDLVIALAQAVAAGKLQGLRLILIDGPPGLDLSAYEMHTVEDIVAYVSHNEFEAFFGEAAKALYPGIVDLQPIVDAAMQPLRELVQRGICKEVALAVRDSLEAMATATEE